MRRNINDYFKDVDENVQKAELGDDTARDNLYFLCALGIDCNKRGRR